MHYNQKQKQYSKNNNSALLIFISMAIALISVSYGIGQRHEANMAKYAQANNCQWHYNGTYYWDDRDYTCK